LKVIIDEEREEKMNTMPNPHSFRSRRTPRLALAAAAAILLSLALLSVALSAGPAEGQTLSGFGQNEDWTNGPYYGKLSLDPDWNLINNHFADVTGDGKADAIRVNDNGVDVRRSTGDGFAPKLEGWTNGPYHGDRGEHFADVTGDGKADAIAVNENTVTVRRSM
jgi:hypothetical protein